MKRRRGWGTQPRWDLTASLMRTVIVTVMAITVATVIMIEIIVTPFRPERISTTRANGSWIGSGTS